MGPMIEEEMETPLNDLEESKRIGKRKPANRASKHHRVMHIVNIAKKIDISIFWKERSIGV